MTISFISYTSTSLKAIIVLKVEKQSIRAIHASGVERRCGRRVVVGVGVGVGSQSAVN